MDKIFISHRSINKKIADIFVDFLLRCGIKSDDVFCSSLPGRDIECEISAEIKTNLRSSKLNIVILSSDYYESAYCQNEAGIIWYNDTKKILIALPEINEKLLEGFLNSENKIRRLNNQADISVICDIIKRLFSDFSPNVSLINDNIFKLINEYENELKTRVVKSTSVSENINNQLENMILNNHFTDDEIIVLKYLFENQKDYLRDSDEDYKDWLNSLCIDKKASVYIPKLFVSENLARYLYDNVYDDNEDGFELSVPTYRNLMKISQNAIKYMNTIVDKYITKETSENIFNSLILGNTKGFSETERLFIKYLYDTERKKFGCGYQIESEKMKIRAWESINNLNNKLSYEYEQVLEKILIRKLIEVSERTSYNNPKEYKLKDLLFDQLLTINKKAQNKLLEDISNNVEINETPLDF